LGAGLLPFSRLDAGVGPPVRRHRGEERAGGTVFPEQILAGRALVAGRLQPVEIAVGGDGRSLSVRRTQTGAPRHDVGDRVILPAATDLHVHLRDPGPEGSAESIATGTVSAALGGVGLVAEMPNTNPPVRSVAQLEAKEARVRGRAAVDVLLNALPGPASVASLARRAGGFKIFLSPSPPIDDVPSRDELPGLLAELGRHDLAVTVHAEEPSDFRTDLVPDDPAGWDRTRPPAAERDAVARLEGRPAALRLHVAHVTTRPVVAWLRERGISCEVTPHHLLLNERAGSTPRYKVNPPLRSEAERAALWEAFARGEAPIVASDHAPHAAHAKDIEFARAPSGMPGVETMLPLLLERVRAGELPLGVLISAACDRPARWLGQPVGRIAPGHRANLIVVDFRARRGLAARELSTACGWTAFEGWPAVRPLEHWRDGQQIVQDGEYVGRPSGRVVRPEYAPGAPQGPA
jgi:dihydroorotase